MKSMFKTIGFFLFLMFLSSCQTLSDVASEAASGRQTMYKNFAMQEGNYESMSFSVNERGNISVLVTGAYEKGEGEQVTVSLMDPEGQTKVENSGSLPFRIRHYVSQREAEKDGLWKVVVKNERSQSVTGKLKVYYPYNDSYTAEEDRNENDDRDVATSDSEDENVSYEEEDSSATSETSASNTSTSSDTTRIRTLPETVTLYKGQATLGPRAFYFDANSSKEQTWTIHPRASGRIKINVNWRGGEQLAVILNGDKQVGYLARKDGKSPITLDYYLSKSILDREGKFRVSVKWFQGGRALSSSLRIKGNVTISYPK